MRDARTGSGRSRTRFFIPALCTCGVSIAGHVRYHVRGRLRHAEKRGREIFPAFRSFLAVCSVLLFLYGVGNEIREGMTP
jgi:hypothetical protein